MRSDGRREFCGALAAVLASRASAQGGRTPVPGLELTLSLGRTEVISGESLALRATVLNRGSRPVAVQVTPQSPVVYRLRPVAGGEGGGTVSQRMYLGALTAGRSQPPLPPPQMKTLAAGQSAIFQDDPALYLLHGLVPGRYGLTASLAVEGQPVESAETAITVTAAQIGSLATLFCPYKNVMATAFDHTDARGTAWLFQRETGGVTLNDGVAFRRREMGKSRIDDVAVAIHTAPGLEGRWVATLSRGSLDAVRVWGQALMAKPAPTPVDLSRPRLVRPAFQLPDNLGLFLVTGMSGGRACVQAYTASGAGWTKGPVAHLATALPARVLARYEEGTPATIRLVWAESAAAATRIYTRPFTANAKAMAAGPKEIFARQVSLLALEFEPIALSPEAHCHALLAGDRLTFVRIPLAGAPSKPQEFSFKPMAGPAEAWAISGLNAARLPVLVKSENRIWHARAQAGGEWRPLTGEMKSIELLHLAVTTGPYWGALWVDAGSGLQFAANPEYAGF